MRSSPIGAPRLIRTKNLRGLYRSLGVAYTKALRQNNLPPNIEVAEFFFTPGAYIEVEATQPNYIPYFRKRL